MGKKNDKITDSAFKKAIETIRLYKIQKIRKNIIKTNIPKEYWGVHQKHCCALHGCKYREKDCPVVLGIIDQKYTCEDCDDENKQNYYYLNL